MIKTVIYGNMGLFLLLRYVECYLEYLEYVVKIDLNSYKTNSCSFIYKHSSKNLKSTVNIMF